VGVDSAGLAPAIAHRLARDVVAAGGLTAATLFLVVGLLLPDLPGQDLSAWERSIEEIVLSVLVTPVAYWYFRREATRRLAWLGAEAVPSRVERTAVLTLPRWVASVSLAFWVLLAVGALVYNRVDDTYDASLVDDLLNVTSVLLTGMTSAGIGHLVADRRLRPVYPIVLAGTDPPHLRRLALRARIVLYWALGSGIPVLLTLILLGWRSDADLDAAIAFLAGTTLVAGGTLIAVIARSLADPLDQLRAAVDRVRNGDLSAAVAIDDATELGYLQSGFNEMTTGLRERQQLQDLFGRHVGTEVAKRALSTGVRLGGEQRDITALFVDLTGSTRLAQTHSPDHVVALLNDFFEAVVSAVTAEGGWVNKLHGDGALCVFGAPEDQPDHAARALRAARSIRDRLRYLEVDFGVGVSSGRAVAGNVGAEDRFEYTIIGDPVNEAARLTEAAKAVPERVLASDSSIDRSGASECWAVHEVLHLRGRSAPTTAYVPRET